MEAYQNQLFGITCPELKEMLEANFKNGITSIQYEDTGKNVGMPGICGEYILPRMRLCFNNGTTAAFTLFVRRQLNKRESKQAHHYRYLSRLGIPTPKLYGSTCDASGCEIMLLSYENEIVDERAFFSQAENIKKFLDLAARLSCVKPSLEYVSLVGRDMAGKNDTRDWKTWMPWSIYILDRIWVMAMKGDLNRELKKLCSSDEIKTDLQTNALALLRWINCLETGVCHSDFRPNNMVMLTESNQLGLIDFEDVMLDARHYDIAQFLGAPPPLFKWDDRLRNEYLDYFIERNKYYGGSMLDRVELKQELFLIWYTRTLNLWEWMPNECGGPGYDFTPAGKDKGERCANIYKYLSALVENRKAIPQALSAWRSTE